MGHSRSCDEDFRIEEGFTFLFLNCMINIGISIMIMINYAF